MPSVAMRMFSNWEINMVRDGGGGVGCELCDVSSAGVGIKEREKITAYTHAQ